MPDKIDLSPNPNRSKEAIFISHATPSDNEFTKWLALKLIGLGYRVWCDILELPKGTDFWKHIENELRNNACKFLIVLTETSNQSQGVLNEIATALKVKKQSNNDTFIIPLIIDENLSFDNINIELVRLNAIDFRPSWAKGLQELLLSFEKENIFKKNPDPDKTNLLYHQIFLQGKAEIKKKEIYCSNWFPINSFPKELRFHQFERMIPKNFDVRTLTFPAVPYKNYLCTFAYEYDFTHQLPKTETYDHRKTIRIPIEEILDMLYDNEFIKPSEAQRLIVQLTNKAFELRMKDKGLFEYPLTNKTGYWFKKDQLEKDKFNKIQLVGKQKNKNWHFGISASAKLYPSHVLMVSSHIFFTEDGKTLIETKSIQHKARRRQGKNWWNDDWKSKLLASIQYLTDENNSFYLEVGSEEKIYISTEPVLFRSEIGYDNPNIKVLEEEAELTDINDLDEMDTVDEDFKNNITPDE
jgi:hypothetical protein